MTAILIKRMPCEETDTCTERTLCKDWSYVAISQTIPEAWREAWNRSFSAWAWPCQHFDFELLSFSTVRWQIPFDLSHAVVLPCYGHPSKPIQADIQYALVQLTGCQNIEVIFFQLVHRHGLTVVLDTPGLPVYPNPFLGICGLSPWCKT